MIWWSEFNLWQVNSAFGGQPGFAFGYAEASVQRAVKILKFGCNKAGFGGRIVTTD
jgi:hypothetical protein